MRSPLLSAKTNSEKMQSRKKNAKPYRYGRLDAEGRKTGIVESSVEKRK